MFHLLYVSAASKPFTAEELVELLRRARENNQRLGITGMLLYKDGDFMQVLEGDEATVRSLFAKIAGDPRHGNVFVIDSGEIREREFGDWSMGFRKLDDAELNSLPGYSPFMNRRIGDSRLKDDPGACLALLQHFRDRR